MKTILTIVVLLSISFTTLNAHASLSCDDKTGSLVKIITNNGRSTLSVVENGKETLSVKDLTCRFSNDGRNLFLCADPDNAGTEYYSRVESTEELLETRNYTGIFKRVIDSDVIKSNINVIGLVGHSSSICQ